MDKKKVLKQMKNAVNKVREKNAVDDVLDSDRIAEMGFRLCTKLKTGRYVKKRRRLQL
jgi:hypothetical protein